MTSMFPQADQKRGSLGVAFVFILIAIIGMILVYTRPDHKKSKSAPAPEVESAQIQKSYPKPALGSYLIRTVVVTGAIIVLIVIGAKVYRRRLKSDLPFRFQLKIVGRKYLSPKQYLAIIKTGQRHLLLGITDNSIQLLTELNDEELISDEDDTRPQHPFNRVIRQFKKSGDENEQRTAPSP
jgi:flagellar biogenesis protein FliO